jgi:hypothetical protein
LIVDWKHGLIAVGLVVLGYWLHSKFPGLLSKASMGVVSA